MTTRHYTGLVHRRMVVADELAVIGGIRAEHIRVEKLTVIGGISATGSLSAATLHVYGTLTAPTLHASTAVIINTGGSHIGKAYVENLTVSGRYRTVFEEIHCDEATLQRTAILLAEARRLYIGEGVYIEKLASTEEIIFLDPYAAIIEAPPKPPRMYFRYTPYNAP